MGTFLEFLSDISRVTVAASSENRIFRDSTPFCKSFYEEQVKYMLKVFGRLYDEEKSPKNIWTLLKKYYTD